jgi:hypothetical protein
MKEYPPIQRSTGQSFQEFRAHVFDKLDGNNVRAEWRRKRGWYKFGSRTQLLRPEDPLMGDAIQVFVTTMAEPLAKLAFDNRWTHLIVFMEYWGDQSFAGQHVTGDPKRLTLFDVCPESKGIISPAEFLRLYGKLEVPLPQYFGEYNWTRGFVESVRNGSAGFAPTFEGVVGKGGERHKLVMAKAKTQAWLNRVFAQYGPIEGKRIAES